MPKRRRSHLDPFPEQAQASPNQPSQSRQPSQPILYFWIKPDRFPDKTPVLAHPKPSQAPAMPAKPRPTQASLAQAQAQPKPRPSQAIQVIENVLVLLAITHIRLDGVFLVASIFHLFLMIFQHLPETRHHSDSFISICFIA